jgi:hypothetical protein
MTTEVTEHPRKARSLRRALAQRNEARRERDTLRAQRDAAVEALERAILRIQRGHVAWCRCEEFCQFEDSLRAALLLARGTP